MMVHLSEASLEALQDLVSNTFDTASVRPDYSGRGAYGRTCLGLVVDGPGELVQFVLAVQTTARSLQVDGEQDEDDADQVIARELLTLLDALEAGSVSTSSDGMGLQVIYYWPRVWVAS
jgi:hypothetical protein